MYDFRKHNFDGKTESLMREARNYCFWADKALLETKLFEVYESLKNYFKSQKYKASLEERSKEAFGQYLQNLIYYVMHGECSKNQERIFLSVLLDSSSRLRAYLFFTRIDSSPEKKGLAFWVDPKEEYTVLISLCRSPWADFVNQAIMLAKETFRVIKGADNDSMVKKFLTHQDKDGFSALITAAKVGHLGIVQALLSAAEAFYLKGKPQDTTGFSEFLTQQNTDGFSALITAAKGGHLEIVQALLSAGKAFSFQSKDRERCRAFINQKNSSGFTPMNAACYEGSRRKESRSRHEKCALLLLDVGANPYIKNNSGFDTVDNTFWSREIRKRITGKAPSYRQQTSSRSEGFFNKQRRHSRKRHNDQVWDQEEPMYKRQCMM